MIHLLITQEQADKLRAKLVSDVRKHGDMGNGGAIYDASFEKELLELLINAERHNRS